MSVSLITGIGEKVNPSRLTRGGCVCVCACVCKSICAVECISQCVFVCFIFLFAFECEKVCVCVATKGASARPGAEIDSLAKERK